MWEDAAGRSILFSVLLRPRAPMPLWPELSLVAGEAVAAALREPASTRRSGTRTTSSWRAASSSGCSRRRAGPCRARHRRQREPDRGELPADTAKPPTSVRVELGREVERAPLLAAILGELERGYDDWAAPYRR